MTEQQPTVGRIVHYVSRGSADGVFPATCRAAVIAAVDDDGCISLCVLNPSGIFFDGDIQQDESDHAHGGTWHWPERV